MAINLAASWLSDSAHNVHLITLAADSEDAYEQPAKLVRHSLDLYSDSAGLLQAIQNNRIRYRAIRKTLVRIDADCVLSFLPEVNVLTILASRGMRHRLVVAERNYAPAESTPVYWRKLRQLCYRWADLVVTQTEKGAGWLREHTSTKAIAVIPNSASVPQNAQSHVVPIDNHLQSQEKCVLAVGRITEQKGFDLLIQAFAQSVKLGNEANQVVKEGMVEHTNRSQAIDANRPGADWKLIIAGGTENPATASKLTSLVADLDLTDRVRFVGRVSNLQDWYQRCDLFVLSSRFEGFPNVLLEAMAMGCPAISTNCDTGPAEIIKSGVNGLLVEPENIADMAESMRLLMNDQKKRVSLGTAASQVLVDFDEASILNRWNQALFGTPV